TLYPGLYVRPFESPETTPERGNGDRSDVLFSDNSNQVFQPGLNILNSSLTLPVALGRKVDDHLRVRKGVSVKNEHPTWLDFITAASGLVSSEVVGKRLLELQSYALTHHANCVDGIH